MSIITPFPDPESCPSCGCEKLHKHGKRDRHVIEHGKKFGTQCTVWYSVQRFLCTEYKCGKTFTLLLPNMLPHKHYAAPEIEQVLQKQEDPAAPHHECGAEESTLRRWKREFPEKLSALAAYLESLTNTSKIRLVLPLQRVYDALVSVVKLASEDCRLAWAFYMRQAHPVRL